MIDWKDAEPVPGSEQPATDEEIFLIKTATEAPKANLDLYKQVLRLTLGIIVTFLGGSIAFLDKSRLPAWALWPAMAMLLGAFVIAFLGVMPKSIRVTPNAPQDIKDAMKKAI